MNTKHFGLKHLFVSATCLLFLAVVSANTVNHPKLSTSSARYGFQKYLDYVEGDSAFKVFVVSTHGNGWAYTTRHSFQQAHDDALTKCRSGTIGHGCKLFAVSNTIVWGMTREEQNRVIAEYKSSKLALPINTSAPLTPSAIKGFGTYSYMEEGAQFKVFLIDERSKAWAYQMRFSYEDAVRDATTNCEQYSRQAGDCRLFAVGNTIVWDMSENEKNAAINAYRKKAND